VTATTRARRPGEVDKVHYHFLPVDEFEALRRRDGLLEFAIVHGNWYGTPIEQVRGILAAGRDAILTIDPQGARSVRAKVPDALLIFVMPPSLEDLAARLAERGSESADQLAVRRRNAEIEMAASDDYDYVIVNETGHAMGGSGERVARVAVDAVADRPERTFSYRLPDELGEVRPGSLLLVTYGRRLALGYLLPGEGESADGVELRAVEGVVSGPMLTDDLLALAEEIAAYYRAPLGTTIAAMLPPGLESRLRRRWTIAADDAVPEALRAEAAVSEERTVTDAALRRHAPARGREAWIERLRRGGAAVPRWDLLPPEVRASRVRVLRPRPDGAEPKRSAPLQRAMLEALAGEERTLPELAAMIGAEPSSLLAPARRLAAIGAADLAWRELARDPLAHRADPAAARHALAAEQEAAVSAIAALPRGGELLLEGVAAAGKTDVYLAAVADVLAAGGTAVVLVPEVTLVPQIADRLRGLVGDELAVMHSGLSPGERHDEWWRILRGEARVVVGTRSAAFAPLERLGLIVIDEAHDGGYKSDRTPRYDARWVARRRAAIAGARIILGSATPDLVSLARVRGGHAERAQLVERRVGTAPAIEVADLRAELAGGNRSIFSAALADALGSLRRGSEQAVLLLNRRGAATFILCRDCGESLRCPDCELPLVYHLDGGTLRCHHCGRSSAPTERCPSCGSGRIRYFGAGTQKVEAELRSRFPGLRIGRLDSDALGVRRGFETIYDDFREGRTDVLVGTQLAAKGLDLPSVTLAGVVAADVTLNLPDYRAAERTFQLLAQVAGRAGRGPMAGHVIFQTYAPGHYAVRSAAALDVDGFADEELLRRRLLGYPPFSLIARLLVADVDRARAEERGRQAATAVAVPNAEVLGPMPSYVVRRAGRYRMQVVIRAPDAETRAAALEQVPPGIAIDVDPESLL
jgi:primosomal protein N' (replication factor Y)